MAKKTKPARTINHAEINGFLREAAFYQAKSRCECPMESRNYAAVARKYLFYVIDELAG